MIVSVVSYHDDDDDDDNDDDGDDNADDDNDDNDDDDDGSDDAESSVGCFSTPNLLPYLLAWSVNRRTVVSPLRSA